MAVKKGMTSLEKDIYSVAGSVGLLAGNIALGGFIPFTIPIILTSITGGMLLDNVLNNKWDKIFQKLSICNGDGVYPKLLHEIKDKNETETKYIFKMPDKLTPYDLMKCQDVIESTIHKPIIISTTKNFYAEVIVYEKLSINYFWYQFFKSCGIKNKESEYPQFVKAEETKIGLKHIFKLPLGICAEMFNNLKPLIQSAIQKPVKLSLTQDNMFVIQEFQVKFPAFYAPKYSLNDKSNKKGVNYIDLTQDKHVIDNDDLVFPVGVTLTEKGEEIVYMDLTDDPHVLVAGINGTGKTSFVLSLLTAMILKEVELIILDLKCSGDYPIFENYKNLTAYTVDVPEAKREIKKIKKIVEERYPLLRKNSCRNYQIYNKKFKDNPMKPIVVVIEEYYMLNTKQDKIEDELNQILAKARACNIKFIIVLQRPCQDNLPPKLKANLNHTVGFYVNNTYNSGIVLGDGDSRLFTDLQNKGEAIIHGMGQDALFKSFFMDEKTIEHTIKSKCITHKKTTKPQVIVEEKPITTSINNVKEGKVISLYDDKNAIKKS